MLYLIRQKMTWIFILSTVVMSLSQTHAAPCHLTGAISGHVVDVIDGDTVTLSTGQDVRLVGIQAPKLPLGRKNYPTWPFAPEAKKALEKLVLGKKIDLRYGGRQVDRHGRLLAHIFIDSVWIQERMIKEGMARVYSFPDNRSCVDILLKNEQLARAHQKGIWRLPFFRLQQSKDVEKLSALNNSFQLVQGKVMSVGEAKGKTYLNFGKDWKTDFTVILPKHYKRHFKKTQVDVSKLAGKTIRIRGWLGFHNGPTIDLTHPEQIEILEQQK